MYVVSVHTVFRVRIGMIQQHTAAVHNFKREGSRKTAAAAVCMLTHGELSNYNGSHNDGSQLNNKEYRTLSYTRTSD